MKNKREKERNEGRGGKGKSDKKEKCRERVMRMWGRERGCSKIIR